MQEKCNCTIQRLRRYYNVREAPVTIMRSNGFHRCRCECGWHRCPGCRERVVVAKSRFHCHSIWFSSPFLFRRVFAQFGVFEVFVIPFVACLPGFYVALSFLFCFQFPSLVWLVVAHMCVCVLVQLHCFKVLARVVDKFYPANTAIFKHLD